jgi:hypothetical protein
MFDISKLSDTDKKEFKELVERLDYKALEKMMIKYGYSFSVCPTCHRESEIVLIIRILKINKDI